MTVRLERRFDASPEELWAALTEPEQLRGWLGPAKLADGRVELVLGEADDQRVEGRLLVVDPPRVLEYEWRWPGETDSVVRFELRADGDGTLLVLDHRLLPAAAARGYDAGWRAYLDRLESLLAGDAVPSWDERFAAHMR
jgi:uncharacterized protein YndB with AHSA1/START domain